MKASTIVSLLALTSLIVGCYSNSDNGGKIKIRETVEIKPGVVATTVERKGTLIKPISTEPYSTHDEISKNQELWEMYRNSINNSYELTYSLTEGVGTTESTETTFGAFNVVHGESSMQDAYSMDEIYALALDAASNCERNVYAQKEPAVLQKLEITCPEGSRSITIEVSRFVPLTQEQIVEIQKENSESLEYTDALYIDFYGYTQLFNAFSVETNVDLADFTAADENEKLSEVLDIANQDQPLLEFLSEDYFVKASDKVSDVNAFLDEHELNITLDDSGPNSLYAASILKAIDSWTKPGTDASFSAKKLDGSEIEDTVIQGFSLKVSDQPGQNKIEHAEIQSEDEPVFKISTDKYNIFIHIPNSEPTNEGELNSMASAMIYSEMASSNGTYTNVILPNVSLNVQSDLEWMIGAGFGEYTISQAKSELIFEMDKKGFKVISGNAAGSERGMSLANQPYTFDRPFVFVVQKANADEVEKPLFALLVQTEHMQIKAEEVE